MQSLGARALLLPTPVLVVGTYGKDGRPNIATAAWAGTCCSDPPAMAVSFRRSTLTHSNILYRKAFTLCVPDERHVAEADWAGMVSGREENKFARLNLTPCPVEAVDAPLVKEFPLTLACRVLQVVEIGLHTQFIGEVRDVLVNPVVLNSEGIPDPERVRPITYAPGSQLYHGLGACLGTAFQIGRTVAVEEDPCPPRQP